MLYQKYSLSTPQQIIIPQTQETPAPAEIKKPAKVAAAKPQTKGIPLSEYMLNFWDYDKSEFIQRYLAHGHNMTKRHTDNMLSLVRN